MKDSRSSAIEALTLFDEKVDKIYSRSFIKKYEETRNSVSINATKNHDGWAIETSFQRADDESVDAIVLTLRFFIQDNEPCSLRNLHKTYNETKEISHLAGLFNESRDRINKILSEPAQPQKSQDGIVTHSDILNAFVYGDLSHSNAKQRDKFSKWQSDPMISAIYTHLFHKIAYEILDICAGISGLNSVALDRLRT
jgi:hypothetical protein